MTKRAQMKPVNLVAMLLVVAAVGSRVDSGQGEGGLSGEISDVERDLLVNVGLVLMPVFVLIQHVSQVYTRWASGRVGLRGRS